MALKSKHELLIADTIVLSGSDLSGLLDGINDSIDTLTPEDINMLHGNEGMHHINTLQDYLRHTTSCVVEHGFDYVDNGNGTINISGGNVIIRDADSVHSGEFAGWRIEDTSNVVLTNNTTNYVWAYYNNGTPNIVVTTSMPTGVGTVYTILYIVTRIDNNINIVDVRDWGLNYPFANSYKDFHVFGLEWHPGGTMVESPSGRYITVTAGAFYLATVEHTHNAFDTTDTDTFTATYQSSAGGWNRVAGQTQLDNAYFDTGTGTLSAIPSGYYGVHWIYIALNTPDELITVYGTDAYATLAGAEAAGIPANLPPECSPGSTGVLVGKAIVQQGVDDAVDVYSPFLTQFTGSIPTTHNNLSGLNQGNYMHLTPAEYGGASFWRKVDTEAIVGGSTNTITATSDYSSILGGNTNTINGGYNSTIVNAESSSIVLFDSYGYYNFIGTAGSVMLSGSDFAFIGAGWDNDVFPYAQQSTILNGQDNKIDPSGGFSQYCTILNGNQNEINGDTDHCFIGTGRLNTITDSQYSAILHGDNNEIGVGANYSIIVGGANNTIATSAGSCHHSFIGGGSNNIIESEHSFIGGGWQHSMSSDGGWTVIVGGENNTNNGYYSFIGCGWDNVVDLEMSAIVAGDTNYISTYSSFIGAGRSNTINGNYSFIGGGQNNTTDGTRSFIGNGNDNTIGSGDLSIIVGGQVNTINGTRSFIGGGSSNTIESDHSFIGGGGNTLGNQIGAGADFSAIVCGWQNTISPSGIFSFIGGGDNNNLTDDYSVIGGGQNNTSSGQYSVIGGGQSNQITGHYAVIIGGYGASATQFGQQSFASGYFSAVGDSQTSKYVLRCETADATPTALRTSDAAASSVNQIPLVDGQAVSFIGTVTAKQLNSTNLASWKVEGVAVREGATTTLVSNTKTVISNTPGWGLTIQADDANDCIQFVFTGVIATSIRVVASIDTSEVIY